ncbi:heteromeric transposase endonuclease subunit TnsA [Gallionella capsiferriformans]|uniref:TnsA endonuclease n=1 Tax=Gallionella capsiferriformans (strain ES-2) TaxID=395494 RepID=D9SFG1_GALCS|nr:heteromeric transposase endonuclease subunit TnsA [Gallionella capsiferriformans]ADL55258.1 TnsA endonuclease [Gallionella capsiferriformans ES-2]
MAKRRYGIDEDKIIRFTKEGRGQGCGPEYRPWLTVQDVSSRGRSSRIHGVKTGREHHLLSDMETATFLLLDWSNAVTDIREQFPLERDVTRRIATEMGVRHPIDSQSQTDVVMTTDFLVNFQTSNGALLLARSVKPYGELDNDRTLEKQEIERRYWEIKKVDWGLITEKDLPAQRIKNLHWLHEMNSLEHMVVPYPGYWEDRCTRFAACCKQAGDMTIKQFIHQLEGTQGFSVGEGLMVLRHLVAIKHIVMNLDAKFDMNAPLNVLDIVTSAGVADSARRFA